MTATELLEQLIAITPYPPETTDADITLAEFNTMYAERHALTSSLSGLVLDPLDPARVRELAAREQAWQVALASTLHAVSGQRVNTTKLRGYATPF